MAAVLIALAVGLFFLGRALGWWDSTRTLTVPANAKTLTLRTFGGSGDVSISVTDPSGNLVAYDADEVINWSYDQRGDLE